MSGARGGILADVKEDAGWPGWGGPEGGGWEGEKVRRQDRAWLWPLSGNTMGAC